MSAKLSVPPDTATACVCVCVCVREEGNDYGRCEGGEGGEVIMAGVQGVCETC